MKNFNKLFPYIIIIAFVVMGIIFVLTRPNDNTILSDIKDKNKAKIEDNKLKEDSLIKVIELLDLKSDSLTKEIDKKQVKIITKIINNEKKYNSILSLSNDSSLRLFQSNYSR